MSKKGIIFGYLSFVVLAIFLFFLFQQINSQDVIKTQDNVESFIIDKGDGLKDISQKLKENGLIENNKLFEFYAVLSNVRKSFLPGKYNIQSGLSFTDLIKELTNNPLANESTVTIIEGLSNEQVAEVLVNKNIINNTQEFFLAIKNIFNNEELLNKYNFLKDINNSLDKKEILQGYLFPDTYRFYENTTADAVIKRMLDNFNTKVIKEIAKTDQINQVPLYEALTLASIVEKEASTEQERRLIADVFLSRIDQGWALESCATINYILKKPKARLTFDDTRTPSPYNTYLNPGLPPGPINNPSLSSILAVINPIENDYCCFLSTPEGKGIFSKTIEEHNRNKSIYLK